MKGFGLVVGVMVSLLVSLAHADAGKDVYTRGGKNPAAMACVSCHGAGGMGLAAGGFPVVAGFSAEYSASQVQAFKQRLRTSPVMNLIADALTDEEIRLVSIYIEGLPVPDYPRITRAAEVDSVGASLALRGDWGRNIPECVSCHGPGGVGVGAAFPPLAGQHASYLVSQLNAWREGARKNDPGDLMGHIARSLTDSEVVAVADYFAAQGQ